MRYRRRTCAAVLATMVAVYTGICAAQTKVAAKVDEYMTATARLDRFSGTILIARNGKILISKGYSLADREWGTPNSATTKFRIGSLTKQFTATAVMMLQDRNSLHVTDPICKYIPSCPAAWQAITIHELLNHTSGIPDYTALPGYQETQSLPSSVQGLVDRFKQQPLKFTAGDKFEYSNSGYVLLGSIIETVSGESYQDFVEENIFRPLTMKDSGYDINTAIIPRRASGYTRNGNTIENAHYIDMSVPFAAGGLYSTVNDLLLWDQALYAQKLVSPLSMQAMFTPYKEFIGYGWAISTLFNRKMIHHNGSVDGFVSNIARFPDDRLLVVVLSNLEQSPVDVITKDLAAIVFGEKYEVPKKRQVVQLIPGQYYAYVGHYTITPDLVLAITRDGNRLFGQLSGQSSDKFELLPESETHFFSEEPPVEVVFTKENGKINGLTLNGQYTGKKNP